MIRLTLPYCGKTFRSIAWPEFQMLTHLKIFFLKKWSENMVFHITLRKICYYTLPLPAEKVSTVKLAGAPTTGPTGSMPGPYARTLHKDIPLEMCMEQITSYV